MSRRAQTLPGVAVTLCIETWTVVCMAARWRHGKDMFGFDSSHGTFCWKLAEHVHFERAKFHRCVHHAASRMEHLPG